jgi:hypothetical protein
MNNAERFTATIDRHLTDKTEIVVFGSAALLLDRRYAERLSARVTNDVDIIIPAERELRIDSDRNFWQAIEAANRELEPDGLYVTHIFPEAEVTLSQEWQQHAVRLDGPSMKNLSIWRPRLLDLVLSKMGRGDAQDIEDVRSWLSLDREVSGRTVTAMELRTAAESARVPAAYQEIFPAARERIIAAVEAMEQRRSRGIHP